MPRWSYALLLLVPAALAAKLVSLPVVLVFVLSATGILPLAALIGKATDELAHQLGPRSGGLLNARFGNAAELIITSFAVRDGLLTLVKASITGSIIGNAAEEYSAVLMAWRNRLNVSLGIAAGAGTQIALFVAPVLVFLSFALGHPMALVFTPLELVILGLATALFGYISLDGESNWLEGVQLLAIYLMAGLAFFFVPLHEAP
jgi:Ca2+/H+ antiporter